MILHSCYGQRDKETTRDQVVKKQMRHKACTSQAVLLCLYIGLAMVILTCSCTKFGSVDIAPAKETEQTTTSIDHSKAKLDPIARYGGYVLTTKGMPHGQSSAYRWTKNMGTLVAYETFIRRYPDGQYADSFREEIRKKFVPVEEEWQKAWMLYSQMETIEGAIVDPNEGFILLGRRGSGKLPPFFYEDLITALRCSIAGEKVGVTMNRIFEGRTPPDNPKQYRAYETSVDFYSKELWNSHLGYTLFEGDRMLKSLSHGFDIFLREEVRSRIPGFKTVIEMEAAQLKVKGGGGSSKYGRIWIELTSVGINTTEDRNVAILSGVTMEVRAESRHEPPIRFAKHIEDNYSEYGREFPVFAEVERAARVVAIARWLVKVFPEIAQRLVDDAYELARVYVPQIISARYDVTHKTYGFESGLIGGVVFPYVNKYTVSEDARINNTPLSHIQPTVMASRPNEKTKAWNLSFDDERQTKYIAWCVSAPKG